MVDLEEINDSHYLELMDRLFVITNNLNDYVLEHPLLKEKESLESKVQSIVESLFEVYSELGRELVESDTEE